MLVCAVKEVLKLGRVHHVDDNLGTAVVLFHALNHLRLLLRRQLVHVLSLDLASQEALVGYVVNHLL